MAELDPDLRRRVPVHEIDQPRERGLVLRLVHAGAPESDAAFPGDAHHLGHHQRRASERLAAQVHNVEVADQTVLGRVHVHRRDDHAIRELEVAQPERGEHRRHRLAASTEPAVDLGHELRIADLEIPVSHPPASGEQVESELERFLSRVLRDVLEPLQACLRRALRALDHRPALGFVGDQSCLHARVFVQACGQRERILHRELGPGPDRKMSRVRGVPDQEQISVSPGPRANCGKPDPAAVVRDQRSSLERVREDLGAKRDPLLVAFARFPGAL